MDTALVTSLGGKTYKLDVGEVTFLELNDQHHYWLNGQYLTSVTHILDVAAPVPFALKDFWQRMTKEDAEAAFETAGSFGTKLHEAFEKLINGVTLQKSDYPTTKELQAIDGFMRWFKAARPTKFVSEQVVASKKYLYAGTLDFVGNIPKSRADWLISNQRKEYAMPDKDTDERWLIDFKTTAGIYFKHELQAAAYKQAHEESTGEKIDRMGILRISNRHKAGFEFKEVTRDIDEFMNVYQTYRNLNGGVMPEPSEIKAYPDTFKLLEER